MTAVVAGPAGAQDLRVRQMMNEEIDQRLDQLAAAYMPHLDEPTEVRFETLGTNGLWQQVTPQDAILARAARRRARVVMEFGS
jgi:hypothetical protein